jgi:hypothetical protein
MVQYLEARCLCAFYLAMLTLASFDPNSLSLLLGREFELRIEFVVIFIGILS